MFQFLTVILVLLFGNFQSKSFEIYFFSVIQTHRFYEVSVIIAISKLFLDAVFATLMYFVFRVVFEFFMGLIVIVVGVILKLWHFCRKVALAWSFETFLILSIKNDLKAQRYLQYEYNPPKILTPLWYGGAGTSANVLPGLGCYWFQHHKLRLCNACHAYLFQVLEFPHGKPKIN